MYKLEAELQNVANHANWGCVKFSEPEYFSLLNIRCFVANSICCHMFAVFWGKSNGKCRAIVPKIYIQCIIIAFEGYFYDFWFSLLNFDNYVALS